MSYNQIEIISVCELLTIKTEPFEKGIEQPFSKETTEESGQGKPLSFFLVYPKTV